MDLLGVGGKFFINSIYDYSIMQDRHDSAIRKLIGAQAPTRKFRYIRISPQRIAAYFGHSYVDVRCGEFRIYRIAKKETCPSGMTFLEFATLNHRLEKP